MNGNIEAALSKAKKMIAEDAKADAKYLKAREISRNDPKFHKGEPADEYSRITSMSILEGGGTSQPTINEDYDVEDNGRFEEAYDSMTQNMLENMKSNNATQQTAMSQSSFNKSRLPKEILKSLSENYIDESQLDYRRDMGLEAAQQKIINENASRQTQRIKEQVAVAHQGSVNVDYSLIKTIVEDCMKKYAGAIVKKVLNENVNTKADEALKAIKIGDKFSFITESGDLYEAELKFKKNINKKK